MSKIQSILLETGTNTGDVTLAAVGSAPSANGASLSGQQLTLQPADATHPGVLTIGSQTIAGDKTFTGNITIPAVVAKYYISVASLAVTGNNQINFDTAAVSSTAVTVGVSWKFTAPVTRNYRVSFVGINSGLICTVVVFLNGSTYNNLTTVDAASVAYRSGSTIVPMAANDTIDLRPASNATFLGGTAPFQTEISIEAI